MAGRTPPGTQCHSTAIENDYGTLILGRCPAPGPLTHDWYRRDPHPGVSSSRATRLQHHVQVHQRKQVAKIKHQAIRLVKAAADSLKVVPLVAPVSSSSAASTQVTATQYVASRLSYEEIPQLMRASLIKVCKLAENAPEAYEHRLDWKFLKRLLEEDYFPIYAAVTHLSEHVIEILKEELKAKLLEDREWFDLLNDELLRQFRQLPRASALDAVEPYVRWRTSKKALAAMEGIIDHLEGFGKFLKYFGIILEFLDLLKNARQLYKAIRDPEARGTHKVALYTMGTAIALCCIFCTVAVSLELLVAGAVMGIVGGIEMAFIEPLAEEKYISPSQRMAQCQMSPEREQNARQIMERANELAEQQAEERKYVSPSQRIARPQVSQERLRTAIEILRRAQLLAH